jgi:archaemetzincin
MQKIKLLFSFFFLFTFLFFSCNKITKADASLTVGILPYGSFSKAKTDSVAAIIRSYYEVKVVILPHTKLPQSAFISLKSPRYRADSLLRYQKSRIDTLDFIFGLTDKDISTTKRGPFGKIKVPVWKYKDWGIMGLGNCPGNSCIISTFRIKHKNPKIDIERLKKVSIHEFGHNLGLPHCIDKKCVMTDAVESITTVDREALALCKVCKAKI